MVPGGEPAPPPAELLAVDWLGVELELGLGFPPELPLSVAGGVEVGGGAGVDEVGEEEGILTLSEDDGGVSVGGSGVDDDSGGGGVDVGAGVDVTMVGCVFVFGGA